MIANSVICNKELFDKLFLECVMNIKPYRLTEWQHEQIERYIWRLKAKIEGATVNA